MCRPALYLLSSAARRLQIKSDIALSLYPCSVQDYARRVVSYIERSRCCCTVRDFPEPRSIYIHIMADYACIQRTSRLGNVVCGRILTCFRARRMSARLRVIRAPIYVRGMPRARRGYRALSFAAERESSRGPVTRLKYLIAHRTRE